MPLSVILALGVLADRLLGEAKCWHPLVGFGKAASTLEAKMNFGKAARLRGMLALIILLAPCVLLADWLCRIPFWGQFFSLLLLYFALGAQSLHEHARAVSSALLQGDLPAAREAVSRIVSRDVEHMTETDVARATVESVLENGGDAIFSTLFWFMVLGGSGVVLHRLSNTLDAMWGYKTGRFLHFGWAAAKFDDVLNWIPARLTVLTYALLGKTRQALGCAFAQQWESPNAGPVMASGAAALELQLGGAASYHGIIEMRPLIGAGRAPVAGDIERALLLVQKSMLFWLLLAFAGGYFA